MSEGSCTQCRASVVTIITDDWNRVFCSKACKRIYAEKHKLDHLKLTTTDDLLHELASRDIPFAIVAERADNLPKGNFFVAWKQGNWGKRMLLRAIRRLRDEIEDALDEEQKEQERGTN